MEYPLTARRVASSALAVFALAAAAACGGATGDEGAGGEDPNADAAKRLHSAQLAQFRGAKVAPKRSELGTYSRLTTTKRTDKLRKNAELDKPECMEAANQWGELSEVREAPTSLATYARGDDTITHTLIEVPAETAQQVVGAEPPKDCESYEATMEDGSTTSYRLEEVDMETVGDGSRAFAVETSLGDEEVWLYSLVYRNGDHLGMTSMLGPNAEDDYRETISEFTEKAVERENRVLA